VDSFNPPIPQRIPRFRVPWFQIAQAVAVAKVGMAPTRSPNAQKRVLELYEHPTSAFGQISPRENSAVPVAR